MLQLSPHESVIRNGLSPKDETFFWHVPRYGDLECFTATFRQHVFPPHTHDAYVIGAITAGLHTYMHGGRRIRSSAGTLCFINPGEVHDGAPDGDGYSYRMSYPTEAYLAGILQEATGRQAGPPRFRCPNHYDPELAARFNTAHALLQDGGDPLAADQLLLDVMLTAVERYAVGLQAVTEAGAEPLAVRRARDVLAARYDEPIELAHLAREAGLSAFHLIRVFGKATGLTPHAWVMNYRVNRARDLLRDGHSPGEVAARCGFSDQAHLTRLFKARLGITPGQYRRSLN